MKIINSLKRLMAIKSRALRKVSTVSLHCLLAAVLVVSASSAIANETRTSTTYYHNTIQGTPIASTDESGNTKWSQTYSTFGFHNGNTGQDAERSSIVFGLSGHVEEQYGDRLLVYMQARYYDPAMGRFLSIDPVGFTESNPQSFNRYAYANNNPHRYVDPDGRIAETAWDVFNIGLGVVSFSLNISGGNYGSAALDAVGIVADGAAAFIPFVPGGAGTLIKGSRVPKKGTFPDEIFSKKAPKQTTPGTKTLEGQYINDKGRVEPWKAHYDDHGRQVGRTDYNAGNKAQDIPDTHHHTYEYGPGKNGMETGSHLPGEYKP